MHSEFNISAMGMLQSVAFSGSIAGIILELIPI